MRLSRKTERHSGLNDSTDPPCNMFARFAVATLIAAALVSKDTANTRMPSESKASTEPLNPPHMSTKRTAPLTLVTHGSWASSPLPFQTTCLKHASWAEKLERSSDARGATGGPASPIGESGQTRGGRGSTIAEPGQTLILGSTGAKPEGWQ